MIIPNKKTARNVWPYVDQSPWDGTSITPVKALLDRGYLAPEDLEGVPEYEAHEICARGVIRIAKLDRVLSRGHRSLADINESKKNVVRAVRAVFEIAKDIAKGIYPIRNLYNNVEICFWQLENEEWESRRSR